MIDFDWLEKRIFHRKLADAEKNIISNLVQTHHFSSGESMKIETHGANGSIYMIRSGMVSLHFDLEDNITHSTEMGEGAQIGDMAFLEKDAHVVMGIIENTVAYEICRAALANLLIFNNGANLKELWPEQESALDISNSGQHHTAAA